MNGKMKPGAGGRQSVRMPARGHAVGNACAGEGKGRLRLNARLAAVCVMAMLLTLIGMTLLAPVAVHAADAVYVDGHTGAEGSGKETSPYSKLQTAYDSVDAGTSEHPSTIYVVGKNNHEVTMADLGDLDANTPDKYVTITSKDTTSTSNYTKIIYENSYLGLIFIRVIKGTVTLEKITIDGGNSDKSDGTAGCTSTNQSPQPFISVNPYATMNLNEGSIIQHCYVDSGPDNSVAVNQGTLNIDGCTIQHNQGVNIVSNQLGTLNFKNGSITLNSASYGGGIYNKGNSTVNITGGSITGNTAQYGGGISNSEGTTVNITGGSITGNTAQENGGGIYNSDSSTVEITGGSITGNTATKSGGGIYNGRVSTVNITGGSITENTAADGGGIYNIGSSTVEITGGSITGNTATEYGGGIYNNYNSSVNITGGSITGNTAQNGGGIYNNINSIVNITGGSITGNTATEYGGGIYNYGALNLNEATPNSGITGTITITGNTQGTGTAKTASNVYLVGDANYFNLNAHLDAGSSIGVRDATDGNNAIGVQFGLAAAAGYSNVGKFFNDVNGYTAAYDTSANKTLNLIWAGRDTAYVSSSTGEGTTFPYKGSLSGDGTKEKPFLTLQEAYNSLKEDGGTICVESDLTENECGDLLTTASNKSKSVTIEGIPDTEANTVPTINRTENNTDANVKKYLINTPDSGVSDSNALTITLTYITLDGGNANKGDNPGCTDTVKSKYPLIHVNQYATMNLNEGSTIQHCYGSSGDSAVDTVQGTLNIDGCTIRNNQGNNTVYNDRGTLNFKSGSITHNSAIEGGGILNYSTTSGGTAKAEITGGSITENYAIISGGGIYNGSGSTVTITGGSSITGNDAADSDGGGIYNDSGSTVNITGGSITGNTATHNGGGIYNDSGSTVNITGGSITKNTARVYGGGIYNDSGSTVNITGGSITGNTARVYGGGIYNTGALNLKEAASSSGKTGTITITGNTGNPITASNVYLVGAANYISLNAHLIAGSSIGVTTPAIPTLTAGQKFATGAIDADKAYFHCDNPTNAGTSYCDGSKFTPGIKGENTVQKDTLWFGILKETTVINAVNNGSTTPASGGTLDLTTPSPTITVTAYPGYSRPADVTITIGSSTTPLTEGTDYTYDSTTGEIALTAAGVLKVNGAITVSGTCTAQSHSITATVTGGSIDTSVNPVTGTDYTTTLKAATGYTLPASITVTVGGKALVAPDCTYDSGTGAINIVGAALTGDVTITAACTAQSHSITATVTGGSIDTSAQPVTGTDYTTTLKADTGYTLPASITVTVGGKALVAPDYTYDSGTGAITIMGAALTGDVTITATCPKQYIPPTTYSVQGDLGGTGTLSPTSVEEGTTYTGQITPATGHSYPAGVTVKVGTTTLAAGDYTYDAGTGKVTIPAARVTGSITVTATCPASTCGVTGTITNGSLTPATAAYGTACTGTITPDAGYDRPTAITVKVGGAELAAGDYTYDAGTGTVTIPGDKVTGDIEIIAVCAKTPVKDLNVTYEVHGRNYGWGQGFVTAPDTAGTVGQGLRAEAIVIRDDNANVTFHYQVHARDIGWMDEVTEGMTAGTTGQSRRIEAVKIWTTGSEADNYTIQYRVHMRDLGWSGWADQGAVAGTTGQARRIEALEIRVIKK